MMDQTLFEVGLLNYYQRLADHSLISQSQASQILEALISPSVPDHHCCPICSHLLVTCRGCSNVTCGNSYCKGANLVSHASSCQSCFSTLAMVKKCSQHDCSARAHFTDGVICLDCVKPTDGHIICLCGDNWICGACATQNNISNYCGRCPGCQKCFCISGCRYIEVCQNCHRMTLCDDCMEEELSDGGSSSAHTGAFLVATCEECQGRICIDCFEGRDLYCESCNSDHCQDCMDSEPCPDCGALICVTCATEGCQECDSDSEDFYSYTYVAVN